MFKLLTLSILFLVLQGANAFGQTDSLLHALDNTILDASIYVDRKEQKLSELREQFKAVHSDRHHYDIASHLYNEYRSYKYDSAYSYATRMLKLAEQINDPDLLCESKVALAFSCVSAGLFKEATEISNTIDTLRIDSAHKADFYSFLSVLNLNMSDFAGTEPYYTKYRNLALQYSRKASQLLDKESPEALMAKMRESQLTNAYSLALDAGEQYLADKRINLHEYAIGASMLGFFYEVKGDTSKAIQCLINAAIADIKMAVKETSAIRQVAELLYSKGDIRRSYDYALRALDDANFYNARQRKIEVGRTLPIIEAGRFAIIEEQKNKLLTYAVLISVLFVLFLVSTLIIFMQKKRLSKARSMILRQNSELRESNEQLRTVQEKISRQNTDLTIMNEKLKEAHRIKDEYIGYFFSANSSYIERMEDYQKMIARNVKNGRIDELLKFANSGSRKEKEEMFALFDKIFIKLFPDFIDRYNLLFEEGDRVNISTGGTLTPEIRIFALIRLGINESERIARFLDFSVSTIKNYKTKVKNKSIVPNELFEHKIMEIESVKTEILYTTE